MSLLLIAALALGVAEQAAPAKVADKKPRMICVKNTPMGSRIPGPRICKSAADWELLRRDDRDETERAQRINTIHG